MARCEHIFKRSQDTKNAFISKYEGLLMLCGQQNILVEKHPYKRQHLCIKFDTVLTVINAI